VKAEEQTCLFQDLSGTKYYVISTYIKLFILKLLMTAYVLRFVLYKRFASNVY